MPIPVTLLTGFLGSGKTSLLNALLSGPDQDGIFVIVNEVGAVGLDHLLVDKALDGAVVLDNGCACCAVRGDLRSTLMSLAERVAAGDLPPLAHVVVETSGFVDPGPLAALFAGDDGVRRRFALAAVVTTADALHGDGDLAHHEEARRQVLFADRVIITKADLATSDRMQQLHARIGALNPTAEIVVREAESDLAALLLDPVQRQAKSGTAPDPGHHHHHSVQTVVVERTDPLDWPSLARWLTGVLSLAGDEILRVKGLAHVRQTDAPIVVQGVHHRLAPPARLAVWPEGDRATRLVFIASATRRNLADGLAASLALACPQTTDVLKTWQAAKTAHGEETKIDGIA
ncbi:CobW family GTP-binding protein [Amorphus coralli]|uniref:CobW family GTP-binding protein n=1 Tax=Amorphus coralli TaxID=340680 RepID=UPI00146B8047|nr:GTP-binding protein [Amorphus coralli]